MIPAHVELMDRIYCRKWGFTTVLHDKLTELARESYGRAQYVLELMNLIDDHTIEKTRNHHCYNCDCNLMQ